MKFLILFLFAAAAFHADASADRVDGDRTISKVIKLLKGMMEKSKEDGEKEAKLDAKYTCFCDTNIEEKQKSIAALASSVQMLGSEIGQLQASNGLLSGDLAELESQRSENEQSVETSDTLREKARDSFLKEEQDMVNAIGQMDQAIDMLADMGADQTASKASLASLKGSVKKHATTVNEQKLNEKKLQDLVVRTKAALKDASAFLPSKLLKMVHTFLQAPFTGDYKSQSGEIVGILKNMRDTFKANLASSRASERVSAEANQKLTKVKENEHENLMALHKMKQKKLGLNDQSLGAKKSAKAEAEGSKDDDEEFLAKLTKLCKEKKAEFEERRQVRANEDAAMSQAVSILNSDEAFASFGKTKATLDGGLSSALLQLPSSASASLIAKLQTAAKTLHSTKLEKLAFSIQNGNPFNKVEQELDQMLSLIHEEEKADVEQKDWCDSERAENHEQLAAKKDNKEELEGAKATLQDVIGHPKTGLKTLLVEEQAKLAENRKAQADETEDRGLENAMYQGNIKNLVDTQKTLERSLKVLKTFYDGLKAKQGLVQQKKGTVTRRNVTKAKVNATKAVPQEKTKQGLVQQTKGKVVKGKVAKGKADPDLDDLEADLGPFGGQSGKATDAVSMLTFILDEAKKDEQKAHEAEEGAQHAFEDMMADLKSQEDDTSETIVDLQDQLAENEKSLEQNKIDYSRVSREKKALENYLSKIKGGCDFITKNIESRREKRAAEESSIEEAKEQLRATPAYKARKAHDENVEAQKKDVSQTQVKIAISKRGPVETGAPERYVVAHVSGQSHTSDWGQEYGPPSQPKTHSGAAALPITASLAAAAAVLMM